MNRSLAYTVAEAHPDPECVHQPVAQISWDHNLEIATDMVYRDNYFS